MTPPLLAAARSKDSRRLLAAFAVPTLAVLWAYWPQLAEAAERWANDPQYSHGYLVPGFVLVLLWLRRDRLEPHLLRPSWWGLPLLLAGLGLRLFGTYFGFRGLDILSLLPCLAGVVWMAGGGRALRWAWPGIAFLFFMIPLPFSMSVLMAGPLQQVATVASTFLLQTLGLPAIAEGNTILLNEAQLGVVEACSGLRMLVIFFALSTGMALVIRRPLWEKLVLAFSAAPIALVSNILRITVTGVLYETAGSEVANAVFHDLAGWLMMPLALGLLWAELTLLRHLLLEPAAFKRPAHLVLGPTPVPAASPARRARAARPPQRVPFAARRADQA